MELHDRLDLFQGMMNCNHSVYLWEYDAEWQLLRSNCPDEHFLDLLLTRSDYMPTIRENPWEECRALLVGGIAGIMWGIVRDKTEHYHVLGPVLSMDAPFEELTELTRRAYHATLRATSPEWAAKFPQMVTDQLRKLPFIPVVEFCRSIAMLYYCVHLEPIRYSDVTYQIVESGDTEAQRGTKDRHRTWMVEKALLGMVRNGDVGYHTVLSQAAAVSRGVPLQSSNSLRQEKLSSQVFASLCTRAAIEGGLTPDQAYTLGDAYIQQIEDCKSISELPGLTNAMYDDFINRVHRQMTDPALSRQIQDCMDYIANHLGEKLTNAELAAKVGYSESSLVHRFKQETGMTIGDYIKAVRLERAKLLLTSSQKTLQQIAQEVGFWGRSHFTKTFQAVIGMTPDEYRKRNGI